MVRVATVLESWRSVRADTAQAVEDFPPSELDFRPAPEVMSFRELALHILQAGHGLTGLLLEGVENFATPDFRERVKERGALVAADADARALAAALRESVETRCQQLAQQPPEFFSHIVTRMDGQSVTRLEMLQFVKEHELSHRGQMFLYLRLKGRVPPTTRRRMAGRS
ncbi:MAG: DinB family protein [Bryobacterales bacterium]|nr:DinB family protein [Bryobacteraceae bacterium]MDW8355284.1 DinB family protein [Bryobacterales bacterium]